MLDWRLTEETITIWPEGVYCFRFCDSGSELLFEKQKLVFCQLRSYYCSPFLLLKQFYLLIKFTCWSCHGFHTQTTFYFVVQRACVSGVSFAEGLPAVKTSCLGSKQLNELFLSWAESEEEMSPRGSLRTRRKKTNTRHCVKFYWVMSN